MHALLGLAASELMQHDSSLVAPAIAHRVKAIKAIKKTLASTPKASTFEEGNALLATLLCPDLPVGGARRRHGRVHDLRPRRPRRGPSRCTSRTPASCSTTSSATTNWSWSAPAWSACHSSIVPGPRPPARPSSPSSRCGTREVERGYYDMLLQIADALLVSSYDGACDESCLPPPHSISLSSPSADILSPPAYKAIAQHYSWWMQLPHEKFQQVVDPNSQVFVLLAAHWISIKQIMVTITRVERTFQTEGQPQQQPQPGASPGADRDVDLGIVRWLKYLNRELDPEYLPFNQWPLWVEAELDRDPAAFGGR